MRRCLAMATVGLLAATAPAGAQQLSSVQGGGPPPRPPIRFEWNEHPTLVMGPVELAFRAVLRLDSRESDAPLEDEDLVVGLDVARRRIGVEGTIGDYVDFQIERELDSPEPWRDVYANVSPMVQLQVQGGRFKLPFGLEENVSTTNLDFTYRSLASRTLAPGRDRGFMVHGQVVNRILRYEVGRFDHDGDNARPSGERVGVGPTLAARIWAEPLREFNDSPFEDLRVGIAWTKSDLQSEGISSIRGQTTMGERYFESGYPVIGQRRRQGLEARVRPGPFSVQGEYIRLLEDRLGESVEDTDLSPMRARGWYLSGSWAVTGDNKADGLAATEHPVGRGIGAIEVAARLEGLKFDSTATGELPSSSPRAEVIIGNEIRAATFGVNWYLNRWVKVQLNLIREEISDPVQGPLPLQPAFWSRVVRFQFAL